MTINIADDVTSIARRLKEIEDEKRQVQNPEISASSPTSPLFISAKQHMTGDVCNSCMRGTLTRHGSFYTCNQCGRNFLNP